MPLFLTCGLVLTGYLLGSIPFGYIAGRLAKIDIREHGSGNIGATNVLRVLGRTWGFTVFALDFLKGVAAVTIALLFARSGLTMPPNVIAIVAAVAAVIGHAFPIWLRLRGGKAVATSLGVVSALAPASAAIVALVWIVVFVITRYVSVASLAAALALPVVTLLLEVRRHSLNRPLLILFVVLAVLICVRHRANLARLLAGTEPRFSRR